MIGKIPISVLDLAPVSEGSTVGDALRNSLDLAQRVEKLGYHRFWVAEHHSMPGIASAATSVVIGHIGAGTTTIRVGSGGIMLSNHAPLVIAEQFGTLEALFPGRVDLGLGRAPGSDGLAMRALRRRIDAVDDFPEQLQELQYFLREPADGQKVTAVPGGGSEMPVWLLGSSDFSARLAGRLGMRFAFAAHFSPEATLPALEIYRSSFVPSEDLAEPYAMVAINVFAADDDRQAERLATSQFQSFLNLIRGERGKIQPPVDDMDTIWSPAEKAMVDARLSGSIIGGPRRVRERFEEVLASTNADELMINTMTYSHEARIRSYEIVADIWSAVSKAANSQ